MLSPYTTPSVLNTDTNTHRTNALQQAKNATTVMEQDIAQHSAGTQDKQKIVISGPTAGPATETPTTASIATDLPAGTDSPTTGAPVAHADHLTLQECIGEAPYLGLIRSVISLPLYIQVQKID